MPLFRRLFARAARQHGYVTTEDARAEGGTPMALVMLARRGVLDHVDYGIYRVPELRTDPLSQYQEALLRLRGGVLSHETALELQDLADVNPRRIHVTVPPEYRIRKQIPNWIAVHHGALRPGDVTGHEGLEVVTPAQAIVDAIGGHLGERFVTQALETARERNLLTTPEERRIKAALSSQRAAYAQAQAQA